MRRQAEHHSLRLAEDTPVAIAMPEGASHQPVRAAIAGEIRLLPGGQLHGGPDPAAGIQGAEGPHPGQIHVHEGKAGAGKIPHHHPIPLQVVGQAVLGGVLPSTLIHAEQPVPVPDELIRDAPRALREAHPQVQARGPQRMGQIRGELPRIAIQAGEGAAIRAVLHVRPEELAGGLQGHLRHALGQGLREALEPGHPVGSRGLLRAEGQGRQNQDSGPEGPSGCLTRGRDRGPKDPVNGEIDEGHGHSLLERSYSALAESVYLHKFRVGH